MNTDHQPGPGGVHGYSQHGISLLSGWLPLTVQIVAGVLLVLALGWRARRWLLVWPPVAVVVGVLGALGVLAYISNNGLSGDPAPVWLWIWIGISLAALVIAVAGWPGGRWWLRAASVLAVPLSVVCVGLLLDQWVGYFPTVQEAWGAITAGPLPGQIAETEVAGLQGKGSTMKTGEVVAVTTPDTASHFNHRQEYVYLPPAYFTGSQPPSLPVVMMIAGEFNTPADWIRTGNALPTLDNYAQSHGGYAPIVVFVDAGGSFNNDTECVNGPRGNAADHLTQDVRPYVVSHFHAASEPANWGIVGWSMGGTCAADLSVMHPELFSTFEDIAGDLSPTAGTKDQTIQRLFAGDAAAWARFDPLTVLGHHAPYPNTAGWFANSVGGGFGQRRGGPNQRPHQPAAGSGSQNPGVGGQHGTGDFGGSGGNQAAEAQQFCAAAVKDGIQCSQHTSNGGHTWQFASEAFTDALPWMMLRMQGTPAPSR